MPLVRPGHGHGRHLPVPVDLERLPQPAADHRPDHRPDRHGRPVRLGQQPGPAGLRAPVRLHVPRRAHPGRRLPARPEAVPGRPHRGIGTMTAVAASPRRTRECNPRRGDDRAGVPDLGEVAGHWVTAADLAHLPSLRNQFGQGHVNADLSSLSWLAAPPYSFGYHTGVLRLDGAILPAQRFRWKPWGVAARARRAPAYCAAPTRGWPLEQDLLLWQIEVTNNTDEPIDADAIPGSVRDGHADRYRLGMALRRSLDGRQLPRLHDAGTDPLRRPPRTERRTTSSGRGRGGCGWASPGCRASSATATPSRCRSPTSSPATSARTPYIRTVQEQPRRCGTSGAAMPASRSRSWSPRPRSRCTRTAR